ncbi:hypothetical protein [Oryzomonas rubra]|uniref:Uncharacterized protein n=1 Tax=Oryzomonas rubra TaxID=2509454 RepID=A0A5A9XAP6_9BACT|nr:hypothetical protein [Oryzomonas rubra]KAA0888741.1 hypothetical protein ET418_15285 [Oryzomonas rubra]
MTPVNQEIVDHGKGDCQRAAIASLFDLDIDQVPNFRKYPDKGWFNVLWHFLHGIGYEYLGCPSTPSKAKRPDGTWVYTRAPELDPADSINGYFYGVVPSKTFKDTTHAVVIDCNGLVVHDPNPNKRWQGMNVLESGDLRCWYILKPLEGTP